jgi:hypothetical protein
VLHFVIIQRTISTSYDYPVLAGEFDPPAADYDTIKIDITANEQKK